MEVKMNKEILDYKEKVAFGLNLRQIVCAALSIGTASVLYFLLRDTLGKEALSWVCIAAAAPFGAAGFFKYNGMPIEKFALALIGTMLSSRMRLYKSENYYIIAAKDYERRRAHDKNIKTKPNKRAV